MADHAYNYADALEVSKEYFNGEEISAKVFLDKYALKNSENVLLEATPKEMFHRIATEIHRIEKKKYKRPLSYDEIMDYIVDFNRIVPQGSPMAGIGNPYQYVTISNCYVVPSPTDSYSGICREDEHIVQISKRRGGVGTDISNLRPNGSATTNAARSSTGIIPFMERYSNTIREVGQCLHRDTFILTKEGLKPISEVTVKDKVWSKEKWVNVNKIIKNEKPCIKIKTKHGREIVCSKEHVFHTVDGEVSAGTFKVGDKVTQIVGEGWEGKEVNLVRDDYNKDGYNNSNRLNEDISLPFILDEKLSYILGYSYGDGYVGRQVNGKNTCLSFSCSDGWEEIKNKISANVKDIFNYDIKIKKHEDACEDLVIFSRIVLEFLSKNEILKQKAGNLIFPSKILESKKEIVFAFLAGYFDADGCDQKSKKAYKVASIDKDFLLVVQNILSSFGIISRIHKQKREEYKWSDIYSLSINGKKSQSMFRELMSQSIKVQNTIFETKNRDLTKSIYKVKDFNTKYSRHSYIIDNSQYISYSTCDRLIEDLKIEKNIYLLQDEVCSISEYLDGENQEVYDLCLDSEHLFFANGLYAHNSGRRGALMLTISIHHPEVIDFAKVKRDLGKVTGANLSIRLSDEFLEAVKKGEDYEQRFPVDAKKGEAQISKMVNAREVWMQIIENAHAQAEPGLLFWDRIISESPADCYSEFGYATTSTNPCGELPLCPYDSCRLLLLNLFGYVKNPFTKQAFFDFESFKTDAQIAQRFMDDLIDIELEMIDKIISKVKNDPEDIEIKRTELELWKNMKKTCAKARRTGTGITALGDALAALGIKYGSKESVVKTEEIYKTLKLACYRSSVEMAKEIGPFEIWNPKLENDNPFLLRIKEEDPELYKDMNKYGRRNIACLTTAPAGSISILTQTTSGIEPLFQISYKRRKKVNDRDGGVRVDYIDPKGDAWQEFNIYHPKVKMWMEITGEIDIEKSPWYGCCADDLNWLNRVKLQAAANRHVDHSISSTINLPEDVTVEEVAKIYETAWKEGCKGITVYRKNCRTGVLVDNTSEERKVAIVKTHATKRPNILPADIYHTVSKGELYFVMVGLLGDDPYEVFAGKNGQIKKSIKNGMIKKMKRGRYALLAENGEILQDDISKHISDDQEAITRLISSNLRHGCDVSFVVHQLEKVEGDLLSYSKAIARVLKKYIPDNTRVHGETCKECGAELVRKEGCISCQSCGYSKCG
jgi:ribonucleoside-diphosphate reductase alpha chain